MEGYNSDLPDGEIPNIEGLNFDLEETAPNPSLLSDAEEQADSPHDSEPQEDTNYSNLEANNSQPEQARLSVDEIMERANAMQERKQVEDEVAIAFGIGSPGPGKNFEQVIESSRTAHLIKQIDDPEQTLDKTETLNELRRTYSSKNAFDALLKDGYNEAEAQQIVGFLVKQHDSLAPKLAENIPVPNDAFKREVAIAEKIAEEEGVSFADVYKDRDLYRRSIRERYDNDPNTYVDEVYRVAEGATDSAIDFAKEQGMSADPSQIAALRRDAANLCRDTTNMSLIRYWGSQELENLSTENLNALGWDREHLENIKDRLRAGGIEESKHADVIDGAVIKLSFGSNFCRERGWDPNNPTEEQNNVLYQQPIMQDPLGQIRDR